MCIQDTTRWDKRQENEEVKEIFSKKDKVNRTEEDGECKIRENCSKKWGKENFRILQYRFYTNIEKGKTKNGQPWFVSFEQKQPKTNEKETRMVRNKLYKNTMYENKMCDYYSQRSGIFCFCTKE